MAAPNDQVVAGDFGSWLDQRLEALGMDPEVYPAYIQGVLREEDNPEERDEALRGILAAFLEEDSIEDVCLEIVNKWREAQEAAASQTQADEVEALASMMEKQAQIVVKPKEMTGQEQERKAALLAQYANVTDEEESDEGEDTASFATAQSSDKSLFKNTNVVDVLNAKKYERDAMREASQKKKEQDKQQREKDKQAKQERKEKEKKRTQKGERKR